MLFFFPICLAPFIYYAPAPEPLVRSLSGHRKIVNCVAFSPDCKTVITGDGFWDCPGCIRLWDTASAVLIHNIKGHKSGITALDYSPNGEMIASGDYDGPVIIWDVQTRKVLYSLSGHTRRINSVRFSIDSKLIASSSDDERVIIWNTSDGKKISEFRGHHSPVKSACFSPTDSNLVASAGDDATVRLFKADRGREVAVLHHDGACQYVVFSSNGRRLISGTAGNYTHLQVNPMPTWDDILAASKSPGKVCIWNLTDFELRRVHELGSGHVSCIAYSPKCRLLAVGTNNNRKRGGMGNILFLDLMARPIRALMPRYTGSITSIGFATNGKYVAIATDDDTKVLLCNVGRMEIRSAP